MRRAEDCGCASAGGSWVTDWCVLSVNSKRSFHLQEGEPVLVPGQVLRLAALSFFFLSLELRKGNKALCGSQARGSHTLPPLYVWEPFSGFPARCVVALQGTFAEREAGRLAAGHLSWGSLESREHPLSWPAMACRSPIIKTWAAGTIHSEPLASPALKLAITVSLKYAPDQL